MPWSPLASGLLTGKYKRPEDGEQAEGRLKTVQGSGNPVFEKFTERNFKIVDELLAVSQEMDRHPAQVALNWTTKRPGVVSTIIGATKLSQLESNLAALEFDIPEDLSARLDAASAPDRPFPYVFFQSAMRMMVDGQQPVHREPPWYRG